MSQITQAEPVIQESNGASAWLKKGSDVSSDSSKDQTSQLYKSLTPLGLNSKGVHRSYMTVQLCNT